MVMYHGKYPYLRFLRKNTFNANICLNTFGPYRWITANISSDISTLVSCNWIPLEIFWTYSWGAIKIYLYDSRLFTNTSVPRKIHERFILKFIFLQIRYFKTHTPKIQTCSPVSSCDIDWTLLRLCLVNSKFYLVVKFPGYRWWCNVH